MVKATKKSIGNSSTGPMLWKYLPYVLGLFILFIAFIFSVKPLLHDGFFATLDDVQVIRIDEMTKELVSGQFPVRFMSGLGNGGGYMLFTFYPPLAFYFGAGIHLLGFTLVKATKLTFISGFMFAGLGTWLLLRRITSRDIAVLGTLLFLSAVFLNYEVYVRGDLAEFFAFALLPLAFWALLRLKEQRTITSLLVFSISYAAVILSHPFVGLSLSVCLGFIFLLLKANHERIVVLLGIIGGLSFSLWYLIPLVFEQKLTQYTSSYFAEQSYKTNFLDPLALSGLHPPNWQFPPPLLGLGLFITGLVGVVIYIKEKNKTPFMTLSASGFIVALVLISPASKPLWDILPQLQYIQFPWRLLVFLTLFAVITTSYLLTKVSLKVRLLIVFVVILSSTILYKNYYQPKAYNYIATYYADDPCGTTTWAHEYMPLTVHQCLPRSKARVFTYPTSRAVAPLAITHYQESKGGREIIVQTNGMKGYLEVRKYFFPGWTALTNNQLVLTLTPSHPYGLLSVVVPEGISSVTFSYHPTSLENNALLLSGVLISLVIASFFILRRRIMERHI